jgi:hypothetical protein
MQPHSQERPVPVEPASDEIWREILLDWARRPAARAEGTAAPVELADDEIWRPPAASVEFTHDEVWREILLDWRGVLLDGETWRQVLGDEIEIGTEEGGTPPWLKALAYGGDNWFGLMFALLTPEHRAAGMAATLGLSPTRLPRTPQCRRSHAPARPRARARRAAKRGTCRAGPDDDPDPPSPRDAVPGLPAASSTATHALPGGRA